MRQRWSVLKVACGKAYRFYQRGGTANYTGMSGWLYKNMYRARRPVPPSAENQKNQEYWDEYTFNAVGLQRSKGRDVRAQIQTTQGNEWVAHTDMRITPQREDRLVSVVHELSAADTLARFQVTVQAAYSGQPLHGVLRQLDFSGTAVSQFKVMNPKLGAEGPDSAVFYLGAPLSDPGVTGLVSTLAVILATMLQALVPAPWGLEALAPGIYGIDVPTEAAQRNILMMTTDFGSAGNIVSHLVAVAVARTWNRNKLLSSDGEDMYTATREDLARVCGELGWELVD